MTMKSRIISMISLAVMLLFAAPAKPQGPSEHKGGGHAGTEETMKAQHERMSNFKEAADMLSNAIIHGAGKMALEGAEKLETSLQGHERDMPHKNRSRTKEFHGLYMELGKRTEKLKAAIQADDLPKAAVAYGRVLEICAACHKKFRD